MLHQHFLQQARDLAQLDPRRPKQVNLRRAVSSAYYAVYHLLVHEACVRLAGEPSPGLAATAHHGVRRWFSHSTMATTARWFAFGRGAPKALSGLFPPAVNAVSTPALRDIASAFVDLQEQRHIADYDFGVAPFTRQKTLVHVERAEQAFIDWAAASKDPLAPLYLLLLLTGDSIIVQR